MLSILVASAKGGCGKSTVSTQLAGYFALAGKSTVLVDADPQGSSTRWCERRAGLSHPVNAVDGTRRKWASRISPDCERLLIDSPAGSTAATLDPFLEQADAVLVPVLPSMFDFEASVGFLDQLSRHPAIAKKGLPVGLLLNRARPWTQISRQAAEELRAWPYPLVGELRDTQAYPLLAALGKCLFDFSGQNVRAQQDDWQAVFAWLKSVNRRLSRG